jgi:hypothetical protein
MVAISGVISGGRSNTDSSASLGSEASYFPVGEGLFDNVTTPEAQSGLVDYRCMYIFNDSETETLHDVKLYTHSKADSDSSVAIGIQEATEHQFLSLYIVGLGNFGSGSFDLTVTPSDGSAATDVTVDYDLDPTIFAQNLETAINTVIDSVTVTATYSNQTSPGTPYSIIYFSIEFVEEELHRRQTLLALGEDGMVISGGTAQSSVLYTFRELTKGSPLDTVATSIDRDTTPPTNIFFSEHAADDKLEVGSLRPLEGFAVWIRRTISAGAEAFEDDGFTLRMEAREDV